MDQKAWIDLARSDIRTRNIVSNASNKGKAIFPLSIIHVEETSRISNPVRRQKLASLMVEVSRGYSFSPLLDNNIEMEVRQLAMERLGLPVTDLYKNVLGKGMGTWLVANPDLTGRARGLIPNCATN